MLWYEEELKVSGDRATAHNDLVNILVNTGDDKSIATNCTIHIFEYSYKYWLSALRLLSLLIIHFVKKKYSGMSILIFTFQLYCRRRVAQSLRK